MTMTKPQIRVAIVGGGLAGATLANALVQHSHLEVHVFESAPEFSERGAAIGLAGNAQQALGQIVPSVKDLLDRAGAVTMNPSRLMLGSGKDAGSLVIDLTPPNGIEAGRVVHRASLLRELLAPLPKELLHASKNLTLIKEINGKLALTFEDGVVDHFDAVIGADGIFGSVRKYVVQGAVGEHAATAAGFWDCRNLVPVEKAKAKLGAEYFEVDRQYGWVGDGVFILHSILENRTMVQCVVTAVEKDPPKDRKRPLTREFLIKTLQSWLDGPIAKGMIDLILDQDDPQGYSQWEHKSTPTYAIGRVCIVGDAAHATTPWQGAGAGQAFEDAMVLGTLFGNIQSPEEIDAAFKAFDSVRRSRCQQVIDSSRGTGQIMCGQNQEVGLDPDIMKQSLAPRWAFLFIDLEAHKQDALKKMREFQESAR